MRNRNLEDLLIIDIETVSVSRNYEALTPIWQQCWDRKVSRFIDSQSTPSSLYRTRAAVMSEFAKIICISCGLVEKNRYRSIHLKSFCGEDEKVLLSEFLNFILHIENQKKRICYAGHNIKEFDVPFICRRLIVNRLMIPASLDFQEMKPWETNLADTFHYWRFGDYKHFTSLELLTLLLDIPSPKDDMDGSMIHDLYWANSNDERTQHLNRICRYCENDVIAVANLILRFKGLPLLNPDDVFRLTGTFNFETNPTD